MVTRGSRISGNGRGERQDHLRHFYASMLIDQRVNLKRIQTLMGHRNIQTVPNVYEHLIERVQAAAQARRW